MFCNDRFRSSVVRFYGYKQLDLGGLRAYSKVVQIIGTFIRTSNVEIRSCRVVFKGSSSQISFYSRRAYLEALGAYVSAAYKTSVLKAKTTNQLIGWTELHSSLFIHASHVS